MQLRRPLSLTVLGSLAVALLVGPASAATETTTRGTAATTSVPIHVEAVDLPVDVGRLALTATTDPDVADGAPWSAVGLTLADIGGARFGDVAVRSDGTTTNAGTSLERDTALGVVGATVGNVFAIADDTAGSATAALTTLTTNASVLEGLGLTTTVSDVVASVDDTGAASTHSLALAGVDLDLAHVLGSVLSTLPLEDLLAIADALGVTVPVDLAAAGDVVAATEALLVAVADATAAATAVEDAGSALVAADGGTLTALQDIVTQLGALDPTDGDFLTDLGNVLLLADFPAGCVVDLTDPLVIADLPALLASVTTCVEDAVTAHLTSLSSGYDALSDAVDAYIAAVTAATDAAAVLEADSNSLTQVLGQLQDLLDALLDADIAAVGPIEVTQQVRAIGGQLDASSASHTCTLTTVSALGGDPVEVADCDAGDTDVEVLIDTITGALTAVLDAVGGVDAGAGVSLELFGTVEDAVSEDADGVVTATSVLEVLRLTIPDITVTPCDVTAVGPLVCALGIDLSGPLDAALTGTAGVVDTAATTVTTTLTAVDVDALVTAIESGLAVGPLADVTVVDGAQTLIDNAVATLETVIGTLTDGIGALGTGGGVTVPGATVIVDPQLEAEHQVITTTVASPDPSDPAPTPTSNDPTLPNTGGGAALLAVLAIGAGAWLWRSRQHEA